MNLNLGIESLNCHTNTRYAFTANSAIRMMELSSSVEALQNQLDNLFDGAKNAMHIRRTIAKYGKTQSIVALVGYEAIDIAQTFSLEGFWSKTKEILLNIWNKIKEWWDRFWGMFFSQEKGLKEALEKYEKATKLSSDISFDGYSAGQVESMIQSAVNKAEKVKGYVDDANNLSTKLSLYDEETEGTSTIGEQLPEAVHVTIKTPAAAAELCKKLLAGVGKTLKDVKKNIDEYTSKAIEAVKKLNIEKVESDADKAVNKENAKKISLLKKAAKIDKQFVSKVMSVVNRETAIMRANSNKCVKE